MKQARLIQQISMSTSRSRLRLALYIVAAMLVVGFFTGWLYERQMQKNTAALLADARAAEADGDLKQASIAYRRYLRREPSDMAALRAYAGVLFERSKRSVEALPDAIRTLQRIVGLNPQDVESLDRLSTLSLIIRDFQAAEELALKWIDVAPTSAEARLTLARAQMGLSRPHDSVTTLTDALKIVPPATVYPLLVDILSRIPNRQEEALLHLNEGLETAPDDPAMHLSAFLFYRNRQESSKAVEHLRRAIDLGDDSLAVLLTAAQFYVSESMMDDAEDILRRAATIAPDDRRVILLQSRVVRHRREPAEMLRMADILEKRAEGKDAELLVQAADLYLHNQRFDDVDRCLKLVDSDPDAPAPHIASAELLRALMEMEHQRWRTAIAFLRRAMERNPANVGVLKALVRCYMLIGDLDAAEEIGRIITATAPKDIEARFTLTDILWAQRRYAEVKSVVSTLVSTDNALGLVARLVQLVADWASNVDPSVDRAAAWDTWPHREAITTLARQEPAVAVWLVRAIALTGRLNAAREFLDSSNSADASTAALKSEFHRLVLEHGSFEEAARLADELIANDPASVDGYRMRVLALSAEKRTEDARAVIVSAPIPQEQKTGLTEALADAFVRSNDIDQALPLYREVATKAPANVSSRLKLIQLTADLKEARQRASELIALEGESSFRANHELARALLRLDPEGEGPVEATKILQSCLAARPRWASARASLGRALELQKQWYDAVEAYRTALAQQPDLLFTSIGVHVVELLTQMGRLSEAQSMLNALTASIPDDPRVLALWINQQIRMRDYQSAQSTARQLWTLQPENPVWPALQADLYLRMGDTAQTVETAEKALQLNPDSIPLWMVLSRALIAQNRAAEAVGRVATFVNDRPDASRRLLLAGVHLLAGHEAEAVAEVERAQRDAGEHAESWAAVSDFWGRLGRSDRQLSAAREVVRLRKEDASQSLILAALLMENGTASQLVEAQAIVKNRLDAEPENLEAMILAARIDMLMMPPDLAAAEARLEKVLSTDPLKTDARIALSALQLAQGRSEAARSTLRVGLAVAPDSPELLTASAKLNLTVRDFDAAITAASHLMTVQPRSLLALQILASAYERKGQPAVGLRIVRDRLPESTATTEERIVLASLYESTGDARRAEEIYRQALQSSPGHQAILRNLIALLSRKKELSAIRELAEQRRLEAPDDHETLMVAAQALTCSCADPEYRRLGESWFDELATTRKDRAADVFYHSARCFHACGEADRGVQRLGDALRAEPLHRQAANDLAWILADELSRPTEAVAVIERFIGAGGAWDGHLRDTYGYALLRTGRWAAAEESLTESLRIASSPVTRTFATYHLALLHDQTGRTNEARAHARQALTFDREFGGLNGAQRNDCQRILDTR